MPEMLARPRVLRLDMFSHQWLKWTWTRNLAIANRPRVSCVEGIVTP